VVAAATGFLTISQLCLCAEKGPGRMKACPTMVPK